MRLGKTSVNCLKAKKENFFETEYSIGGSLGQRFVFYEFICHSKVPEGVGKVEHLGMVIYFEVGRRSGT